MAGPFSEGGAAQLHHDITKGLVPLLSNYCDDIARMQLLERYYRNPYNFYCSYEQGLIEPPKFMRPCYEAGVQLVSVNVCILLSVI